MQVCILQLLLLLLLFLQHHAVHHNHLDLQYPELYEPGFANYVASTLFRFECVQ